MRIKAVLLPILMSLALSGCQLAPAERAEPTLSLQAERLIDRAIVDPDTDPSIGSNIQGPSLIAVPGWVKDPLGKYYLYFADHKGDSIRLAYADALEGPWRVYAPGALRLEESGFPVERFELPEGWSLSGTLSNFAPPGTEGVPLPSEDATIPHIASPDVHVDHQQQKIIMYFHGLEDVATQRTRVASSADGLNFSAMPDTVGPAYMRVFKHRGEIYAMSMPGTFWRSADGVSDFEKGPQLFSRDQRHSALYQKGDMLYVFWTRVGDAPERIYMSEIDISGDWLSWSVARTTEVLRPERPWEGADLLVVPSYRSAVNLPVNQVRDPAIFEENGEVYLLYSVQGERGIGIARLNFRSAD